MKDLNKVLGMLTLATLLATTAESIQAQTVAGGVRALSSNLVVPQSRSFSVDRNLRVQIAEVKAHVEILEQVATTTLDISLRNPTARRLEAELLVPVPDGAVVKGFTFRGSAQEPTAEILPKDKANEIYKSIVAKLKDPAILEFAGYNLVRSSVFPVDARGTQQLRLTYEHLLTADGERIDYVLPRTESVSISVPWEVSFKITSKRPISTVYSPSHKVAFRRAGKNVMTVELNKQAMNEPGPLQLSYLQESGEGVTASLFAYPDPKIGGGYFLLLAGLPAKVSGNDEDETPSVRREVTIVIDRSGSMSGDKLKQAKEAALLVVEGLLDSEAFNIIDYSDSISMFAPSPAVKNKKNIEAARHYIRALQSGGGTNIHDTLIEALRQKPKKSTLPIVLFLTDGLPTVGVRDEVSIRNAIAKANKYERRIFTFGVGYDVNAPLLTHLAENSRAVSTFVLPNEEIEAKMSQVYRRLYGPVLAAPSLEVVDENGKVASRRVGDLQPRMLSDLFEGDQLVLLGQYKGEQPLRMRLKGEYFGRSKTFQFNFKLDNATTKNSFVARLWASRKIAMLVDEIRQAGAENGAPVQVANPKAITDPKMKELVDEIVRLSVEFGILTEYTAFLAREGTDLTMDGFLRTQTGENLRSRAQLDRSGIASVNQALNVNAQRLQINSNRLNAYYDRNMKRVQITRVQQIGDRAYFRQGNAWVDGRAINSKAGTKPSQTITVGSPEFMELLSKLVKDNQQGALSMPGEVLIRYEGKNILIKGQ